MSDKNGLDVIARLKEHSEWNCIPVMLFAENIDDELLSHALASGAISIINKPFVPEILLDSISNHI